MLQAGSQGERYQLLMSHHRHPAELVLRATEPALRFDNPVAALSARSVIERMMFDDLVTYLPGDILTKVDRASMSVSLEARVPLLDHHLVEFAVALPGSVKYRNGNGKWILREAIKGLVPASVLEQPKRGFAVPLNRWFNTELSHRLDTLLRPDRAVYEYVDHDSVSRLVREHRTRRRDHSHYLWRILVLDLWLNALRGGEIACALEPLSSEYYMARSV